MTFYSNIVQFNLKSYLNQPPQTEHYHAETCNKKHSPFEVPLQDPHWNSSWLYRLDALEHLGDLFPSSSKHGSLRDLDNLRHHFPSFHPCRRKGGDGNDPRKECRIYRDQKYPTTTQEVASAKTLQHPHQQKSSRFSVAGIFVFTLSYKIIFNSKISTR